MIGYANLQQTMPNYNTNMYSMNNYNNYNSLSNYTNYNSSIFNNYGSSSSIMAPQMTQQMYAPQMVQQQDNSSNMMQMLMGLFLPLLMQLLGGGTNTAANNTGLTNLNALTNATTPTTTTVDQTNITVDDKGIWGDPHYTATGADGKTKINFTHDGKTGDTYNVFEGDGYEIEGKYGLAGNNINKILDTTIKAGNDSIGYNVKGEVTINGETIKDGATVKLNDGTKVTKNGKSMILESREGDSKVEFKNNDGICLDPSGKFSNLGGILGTAISENRNLSEEEANKFDITKQ